MNYSVSKNRDGIFWSLIFRDRRNRDGKFPSLFPSLFSIRDGIPSLFSVSILQFSCSVNNAWILLMVHVLVIDYSFLLKLSVKSSYFLSFFLLL